jgi:hypothetical protein
MMPAQYYIDAARKARYHVQGPLVQRSDNGWARLRVERVFRGDRRLAPGDELVFCVPVRWPHQQIPAAEILWTSIATWRATRFVEAFLDGDPPECTLAGYQWTPLPALTRRPTMTLDGPARPGSGADDPGGLGAEAEREERLQLQGFEDARPVLSAEDLVGHVPAFEPEPGRATWTASCGGYTHPGGFAEAFLPARVPIQGSYTYSDARHPLYLSSEFHALERDAQASGWFEWKLKALQGWVKPGLMQVFTLDRSYRIVRQDDLWRWGDRSASFVIRMSERNAGHVFCATRRSAALLYVLAGAAFDRAEAIDALLGPVLRRVETYCAHP